MVSLLFATQNKWKCLEVQAILGNIVQVISLPDLNFYDELPETGFTLEENALEKAQFVYEKFHRNCFAEDTGLGIEGLNGEPGVYSARYAGKEKSAKDNIHLVLEKMKTISNRKAQFKTVVCLIINGGHHFFEGVISGNISMGERGESGFGYDPIFVPEGHEKTFAEMTNDEKNKISHRKKAIEAMREFLMKETPG